MARRQEPLRGRWQVPSLEGDPVELNRRLPAMRRASL